MKVLLADDNAERLAKLIDFLTSSGVVERDDIVDKRTSLEAREFLRTEKVDLLVLDILLPKRVEDDPLPENSLSLLTELSETDKLLKPRKVVGLTAYAEVAESASRSFVDRTWTIVESTEVSDEWMDTIAKCVEYLRDEASQPKLASHGVDLLVVCALRDEMDAVHRWLPWSWQAAKPIDDNTFISSGRFVSRGNNFSVATVVADRMGMVCAGVLAAKLFQRLKPRVCVMPGICAGVPGRAAIGDVILADLCWDYQSGKYVVDANSVSGFEIEPNHIPVDGRVAARIDQLAQDTGCMTSAWRNWPADKPQSVPRLLRGPIASGSAVLADATITERISKQQRKVRGIEMELYGIYLAAAQCAAPRPVVLGMKGVCDYADKSKGDSAQPYAAYMSAMMVKEFFERYMADFAS